MSPKTFIVTGASRGIGLAISKFLLAAPQSHNVVVIARTVEPLQKLKDQYGKQVEVLNGDLADFSLGQKAVDLALKSFGRLDGLVLNHGIVGRLGALADTDPEHWKQAFDLNCFTFVALVKAALPALRESKGRIIFTSSGLSVKAIKGCGLYGATKAIVNYLALIVAEEEPNVTSLSIEPGAVDTEMQREIREDNVATLEPQIHGVFATLHKNGLLLKPEQPAHVIAKLVIDAPNSLNGQYLSWNDQALEAFQ